MLVVRIIFLTFLSFFCCLFISFCSAFFYFRVFKKVRPIKNETKRFKQHGFLRSLLIDFPYRFVHDKLTIDPNTFSEYGLHLLCGEQGSGKTMLMSYLIRKYKTIYPKLKVRTNFNCIYEDFALNTWEELTLNTNGIYGELDCIDEIQNWFSSNASKNFPPDMLTIITQQRKVRRCILATSQVFTRIGKPLRENTYLMYYPFTVAGCLTFVRVFRPVLDSEGCLTDKKLIKFFFFVHDDELRNCYDSYKTICTLRDSGFIDVKKED